MSKDEDEDKLSDFLESVGYTDEDFDGDVDWYDVDLYEEDMKIVEEIVHPTNRKSNFDDEEEEEFADADDSFSDEEDYDEDADDDDDYDDDEEEDEIVVDTTVEADSSETEDDGRTSIEDEEYSYPRSDRVPPDFIKRDYEEERRLGIKDIHFYCYWLPDFDSILIIQGEIIAESLKGRFTLCGEIFDKDGDLIEVVDNFSYTGGAGFVVKTVMPEIFFNRYPFRLEFHLKDRKIPQILIFPTVDEDDEEEAETGENIKSISTFDVERRLKVTTSDAPIMVSRLERGEKIPKSLVQYVIEKYTGITDIKCVFFKEHENTSEYWSNHLTFTTVFSGKVRNRSLMYFLFYNEDNELVDWTLKDIWDNNYKNKTYKDFVNLPLNVKIGRIIIYIGAHPSSCTDMLDELKK